jgi:thymidylate synthase|tara:strand:+ start:2525 stop:3520 length:996 start_codon:yes stop_codon:yes gene_type:complete
MLSLDQQYQNLLVDILNTGLKKEDRTGTGTLSVFGRQFRHKMSDGFPLLTTKKMPFKLIVTELLWFLRGDTNIKYLIDNGCNIWNGDAYKKYTTELETHYLEGGDIYNKADFIEEIKNNENGFAKKWGELGPIYGKQWRDWDGRQERDGSYDMSLDQMANLIFQLKRNPDSRRLMVNAWNVGELSEMTLPPCHYGFQVYTRLTTREEKIVNPGKYRAISLMWNQRSVDTFLGLPFNIASYGLLLEILAKEVGMIPDELIGNFGDVHLYSDHLEQATEQLTRVPCELSSLIINDEFWNPDASFLDQIDHIEPDDFYIKDYQSHKRIKAPLSN